VQPAGQVRVEGCRFTGPGVHVALHDSVADVALSGNIFVRGRAGLGLAVRGTDQVRGLTVDQNSFFGIDAWLALNEAAAGRVDASVTRNLIIQCQQVRPGTNDLTAVGPSWFRGNWWRKCEGMDEAQAQLVAELKDQVPLLSEDPDHPDFLRPAAGTFPADGQVGARAPRTDNPDSNPKPNK
jgi:hypothetical protein